MDRFEKPIDIGVEEIDESNSTFSFGHLNSAEMVAYTLSYAPGNYRVQCWRCDEWFDGDKRASMCLKCWHGHVWMKRVPLAIITLILFITVATCAVWLAMLAARVIF